MALHAFHPELLPLFRRLEGSRILLMPFAPGDGAALYEAVDEDRAHLRAWLPWVDHHRSADDSEAFARRAAGMWLTREDLIVAIHDIGSGGNSPRILGGSGLHRIDWERRAFEIGYWLRKSATNKGHVTEAVQLLSAVCFDRLDASRVEIRCDPRNTRSAAIPERLGYVREAHLRNQSRATDGSLRDTLVYALTPSTFIDRAWAAEAQRLVAAADRDG